MLTTLHAKSIAIAPVFWERLGANIIEYVLNTDKLGTFSGEVQRQGSALECAQRKCELALNRLGDKVDFALASEGSFGPHPFIPFMACDNEILYFIDKKRGFHLHVSVMSEKTNYRMQAVASLEELYQFAQQVQFPSHALILRPSNKEMVTRIFKGICSEVALLEAYHQAKKAATDGMVWVETDMRANFNPSRMQVIASLSLTLAERLATLCPHCAMPGWGVVGGLKGLRCSACDVETDIIKSEILGCTCCNYKAIQERSDGLKMVDPSHCGYCNP